MLSDDLDGPMQRAGQVSIMIFVVIVVVIVIINNNNRDHVICSLSHSATR